MTFKTAFVLAILMVVIAVVNRKATPGYFAMVVLYLLLSSFIPWLMVPIGVVIIVGEVLTGKNSLADWIGSFGK